MFCVGMTALLAGCSDNDIVISATALMQTHSGLDDGADGSADDTATQGQVAGTTVDTGVGEASTTGGETGETSTTTGGTGVDTTPVGTTGADTTGADTTGEPDTTSGGPVEPPKYAVLNGCTGAGLYVADLEDGWKTTQLALPKGWGLLGVAVSKQHIYIMLPANNTIARYDFGTGEWAPWINGPAAATDDHGWIEYVGGEKVCLAYWGQQEVHCYDGDAWRSIPLTVQADWWASWDHETDELYVKPWKNNGFQVVDLGTDTIVRTFLGEASDDPYNKCLFDYEDGYVYIDRFPNPIRMNALTGGIKNELVVERVGERGAGAHPLTGEVFFVDNISKSPTDSVHVWNPETLKATLLPYEPNVFPGTRVVFQSPVD